MGLIQKLTPEATYQQELSSDLRHPSRVAGQKKKKKSWKVSHIWLNFQPWRGTVKQTFPPTTVNTHVQPSAFWGFQMWMRAPKTENKACNSADATTQRPSASVLRGSEACEKSKKTRMLASDSWEAQDRNDFKNPTLLHLPIQSKFLNLRLSIFFN